MRRDRVRTGRPVSRRAHGHDLRELPAAGFTRALWENRDTEAPFTLTKNPGEPHEASFTGTVTLKAPGVAVQPTKLARNTISLPVSTVTLAAAV